jgi:alpha-glucosidase (family GH31 glycosyl hydrolase)
VQTLVSDMPLPTDEFFVRWTEVSAFLPILQFSYFPWNYAAGTAAIALAYARVHKALEAYLAAAAAGRRSPLVRPLWYDALAAEELYAIADEFMLGPDLVIAPVLAPEREARDVALPPGAWRDAWTGATHEGRLAGHPAPCPGIPVFVRASNEPLFRTIHEPLSAVARGTVRSGHTSATYTAGLDRDLNVTG